MSTASRHFTVQQQRAAKAHEAEDAAPKPGNIRTLNLLREAWMTSYDRAFQSQLLPFAIIPDIVRGLAFLQLAAQDDETDANVVLKRLEAAVLDLLAELSPALAETRKGA